MSTYPEDDNAAKLIAIILNDLIKNNRGGNHLQAVAVEVEAFFRNSNYYIAKRIRKELEVLRISTDSQTARDLYCALQRIAMMKDLPCSEVQDAVSVAEEAMKKARGEA